MGRRYRMPSPLGGDPSKNWVAGYGHLEPPPHACAHLGGGRGGALSPFGLVTFTGKGTGCPSMGPHTPLSPTPLPTQAPTPTTPTCGEGDGNKGLSALPPTVRHGERGVGHTGGKRIPHGNTPSSGSFGLGDFFCHFPRPCSAAARSGSGGRGGGPNLPIAHHTCREGSGPLDTTLTIRIRGRGGCRPNSQL